MGTGFVITSLCQIAVFVLMYSRDMSQQTPKGNIDQSALARKNDYLYRLSIKGLIINDAGEILVVKESNRTSWDLPGGGMDHGEDMKSALARELKEEVNLTGDFTYRIVAVDDPVYLKTADALQVRLIFHVRPSVMNFSAGIDADKVSFIAPEVLRDSDNLVEKLVYEYAKSSTHLS